MPAGRGRQQVSGLRRGLHIVPAVCVQHHRLRFLCLLLQRPALCESLLSQLPSSGTAAEVFLLCCLAWDGTQALCMLGSALLPRYSASLFPQHRFLLYILGWL